MRKVGEVGWVAFGQPLTLLGKEYPGLSITQAASTSSPLPQQAQTRFRWCGVNQPERMTNHVRGALPESRLTAFRNILLSASAQLARGF